MKKLLFCFISTFICATTQAQHLTIINDTLRITTGNTTDYFTGTRPAALLHEKVEYLQPITERFMIVNNDSTATNCFFHDTQSLLEQQNGGYWVKLMTYRPSMTPAYWLAIIDAYYDDRSNRVIVVTGPERIVRPVY